MLEVISKFDQLPLNLLDILSLGKVSKELDHSFFLPEVPNRFISTFSLPISEKNSLHLVEVFLDLRQSSYQTVFDTY
jgi:hypothetical protein